MDLQKYKVCPVCGEHNPPSLLECRKCETDLTGIKVVDANTIKENQTGNSVHETSSKKQQSLVRVCECGAHNPPQARKCARCGEDISDILPTMESVEEQPKQAFCLKEIGGSYKTTIDLPMCVLGREGTLKEFLKSKVYVSRKHARITIANDKVFIENLSTTNKTFINNIEIQGPDPVELNDGDEIGLGGKEVNGKRQANAAYFSFSKSL